MAKKGRQDAGTPDDANGSGVTSGVEQPIGLGIAAAALIIAGVTILAIGVVRPRTNINGRRGLILPTIALVAGLIGVLVQSAAVTRPSAPSGL